MAGGARGWQNPDTFPAVEASSLAAAADLMRGFGQRRRWSAGSVAGALGLAVGVGYLCFELGRYQSGYALLDQRRERAAHREALAARDADIDALKRQVAVLETSREIDAETYAQVAADLGKLEVKIQAQEEELAFLRGIVSPQDGFLGLRVQNLEVVPADAERRYLVRLVLVQAIIHDRSVTGIAKLSLAGSQNGRAAEFDLEQLAADDGGPELRYRFRYFQGFEREVLLPLGFEPDRIEVEIWPSEAKAEPVKQSFPWPSVAG